MIFLASKKRDKYHAILEGALKVFAETGFHRTQVSRIAKAAGVADGTIYLYFSRKEDILIHLFREKLGELIDTINAAIEPIENASEALRTLVRIHYSTFENNVDLAYVTQIELLQSDMELRKEIGKTIKPYFQLLERLVVKGIEQGLFRPNLNVKLTRLLLFGSMNEVLTSWLISGRKYSLIEQTDDTVDFWLRGIQKDA